MRQWHDMLRRVLRDGEPHDDRTGVGTLSVFGHQERFNLLEGFPLVTTKRVPLRWIAEELFWILRGSTDEEELRLKGVDIWKEWADVAHTGKFGRQSGDLGPTYGFLMRRFGASYLPTATRDQIHPLESRSFGFDQLARLVYGLRWEPNSRRHVVSLWDPRAADKVDVPPCPCFFQVKVHAGGHMSLHLFQRSADLFLGVPFDIAEYALLLEMLCFVFGVAPFELVVSYGDLHLYKNHVEPAKVALARGIRGMPTLRVRKSREDGGDLDRLLSIGWDNIDLENYDPWPKMQADVAV